MIREQKNVVLSEVERDSKKDDEEVVNMHEVQDLTANVHSSRKVCNFFLKLASFSISVKMIRSYFTKNREFSKLLSCERFNLQSSCQAVFMS